MDSLICEFHSTPHLYKGDDEPDLRLEIHKYGSDAIQIKLFNKDVPIQKKNIKKQFVFYVTTSACYLWLQVHHRLVCVEVLLGLWLIVLLWRWTSLVESENLIFCYDFGMNLLVKRWLGKSNTFIASSNIHDIRINEVIENLDFRYLLIIRTKGRTFRKRPIIPVFQVIILPLRLNVIFGSINRDSTTPIS